MICLSGASCWQHDEGVPTLRDIGTGLGRIARFAGQTRQWYPVLAHVLTVATIMEPKWAIYGLMHDAPEALTSDVPTPWKHPEQRELEHVLYERLCKAYGLSWPIPEEAQVALNEADYQCLIAEAYVLGHAAPEKCVRRSDDDRNELVPIQDQPFLDTVAELTRYNLSKAHATVGSAALPAFMHPEIAGVVFEEAFNHYLAKSVAAGLEVPTLVE